MLGFGWSKVKGQGCGYLIKYDLLLNMISQICLLGISSYLTTSLDKGQMSWWPPVSLETKSTETITPLVGGGIQLWGAHACFPFFPQMGEVWNELQPKLGCLFGANNGLKSSIWAQSKLRKTNTAADEDEKLENNSLCELKQTRVMHRRISFLLKPL